MNNGVISSGVVGNEAGVGTRARDRVFTLNQAQQEAVLHVGGPLLIIAGAGTGKTRVISERILNLIHSGEAKPEEILALTFTEKAATEMLERTDEGLPLGYEELSIKTFHGFSDQILRESGLEIGIDPGYKILTQVDQWFFFKKHIFDFPLDYYRPLGSPNRFIYDLLGHFSKLKDELVTPEAYLEYAKKLEEGEEREKLIEVAHCYARYQELLMEGNFLDFADLTYKALELLDRRESVLAEYQRRYKYILVDEFQDTNYAQFQLVLKLAAEHKNIVVVGDDDQSIYKWRGASLSNILQFEKEFPGVKKIVLTENYRSSQNILDASYALIQGNNPDRLEVKNDLVKKLEGHAGTGEKVQVHQFPNYAVETDFVAGRVKELRDNGVDLNEIAILVRTNALAHPFIEALKGLGIPYQVRNPKGLLALSEIKDLLALLRVLANPYDDVALLRVLKMDCFEVEMSEILELLHKGKKEHLIQYELEEDCLPGMEGGIQRALVIVKSLVEFSKNRPVGLVINEFLNESGYLKGLVVAEKFEELENINEFAKQVARFEREQEDNTVLDFVNYLDLLEESNTVLAADNFKDRDSVQILTVHGSKGLEFEHVFVVSAVKQRFPGNRRRDTFELPEALTKEIYPEGDFHIQEERRLFYVAMTRAKKGLYLCLSEKYEGNKSWKMSPFVQEVLDSGKAELIVHEDTEDAIQRLQQFKEIDKPIFELPEMSKKRLSYSQFNTFDMCPLKYNYRYILDVPVEYGHAASFGSSVHDALNEFYMSLKSGQEPSLELLRSFYDKCWIPYGYESKEHEELRKDKGWGVLENFYKINEGNWIIPAYLERPFTFKAGIYSVSGRIDRIDRLEDGTYEVIDYKTGRVPSRMDLTKDLQLSIYALACRDVLKLPVSKLSLYSLEGAEKFSTTRSDAEINGVYEDVKSRIEAMKASDFPPTPGFHCKFCDFKLICPAV